MKAPKQFKPNPAALQVLIVEEAEEDRIARIQKQADFYAAQEVKYARFKTAVEFLQEQGAVRNKLLMPLLAKQEEERKAFLAPIIYEQELEYSEFHSHLLMREANKMAKEKKAKTVRSGNKVAIGELPISGTKSGVSILITKNQCEKLGFKPSDKTVKVKEWARKKLGLE